MPNEYYAEKIKAGFVVAFCLSFLTGRLLLFAGVGDKV